MNEAGFVGNQQMCVHATGDDYERRVKTLNSRLLDAVECENYEDAAKIRDMIRHIVQKENANR